MLLLLLFPLLVFAREFQQYDKVPLVVNTVGPFNNPAETYRFYSLPFCRPSDVKSEDEDFGDTLAGDRRRTSLYEIHFRGDTTKKLCTLTLNQNQIKKFRNAIKEHYFYELFLDDLPLNGFVGEIESSREDFGGHQHNETHFWLFTHIDFSIAWNGNNVIACNLTTDRSRRVELTFGEDIELDFTYSVKWVETNVVFIDRLTLHSRSLIANQGLEIHWLSIINSFVLVVLLTAFSSVVLIRALKKDFAKYMELEEGDEEEEDSGWKLVHGDVFRFPRFPMLLSAAVGTGTQILVLSILILLLSLVGTFYPGNRGALYTAAVTLYALTAGIAGYVSTRMYLSMGEVKWATNAVVTALVFVGPLFLVFCVLNSIAIHYGSSSALPFTTIMVVFLLWALVTFPLTIFGAFRGKANSEPFDAPCKTKPSPGVIPELPWYRSAGVQYLISGFLPFSAIYIELHYILVSIWGHRVYTLFGILCLAFTMLLIVTAFITVTLTYFQLAAQDYHWWWRAFISGSFCGVFMFLYSAYYYSYRSQMNGLLQGAFFFGYSFMMSYAFALMLGAVGYHAAVLFVKHIYRTIKVD